MSVHRVNVNFTEDAYAELVVLAGSKGKTISDVLRDAIVLEFWFDRTVREGGRILVERGKSVREVTLRG